ncbi:MAG TPA: hypothetical protein PLK90_09900 [Clostridiales bacterium]|nr:hypothetical protein [Clostridiales bacterium]HQP70699.1 hypothetical protein [Clostridiales bacterium]
MKTLSVLILTAILLLTVSCSQSVRKAEPAAKRQAPVEEQIAEQTPVAQPEVKKEVVVITRDANEGITDPLIEDGINWSNRTITATGIGAPNPDAPNMAVKRAGAINAAKIVALRDLIATMKGMYLSSEQTAENYMMTSDVVKTQIEGIAKAFKVVGEPKYFEDGSVEVTVEMSLNGDLSDVFLKNAEFGEGEDYPLVPEATYKLSDLVKEPASYTGIIIDCTGVQLRPALAPKVFSKSGDEIYGSANVNKDYAVQQGMMGYLKSVTSARENSRVTNNPLIINAIGVKGTNKADIIISDEDAVKLKELDSRLNVLKQCRVIAVII